MDCCFVGLAVLCDKKEEEKDSNQVNVCYVFVIRLVIVRFLLNGQISTQKSSIVRALVLTIFQSM